MGNVKSIRKYPELFTTEDIVEMCEDVHNKCMHEDCSSCHCKNDVEDDICKVDLILELYRRLMNADPAMYDCREERVVKKITEGGDD